MRLTAHSDRRMAAKRKQASAWRRVAQAVFCPSPAAVIGGFALAAALMLWTWFGMSQASIAAIGPEYLIADREDSYGYITAEVLRAAERHTPGERSLTILGASGQGMALLLSDDVLGHARDGGLAIDRARNFTTGGMRLMEMRSICERLGPALEGIVVIGVAPGILTGSTETRHGLMRMQRLGFKSDAWREELEHAGLTDPSVAGEGPSLFARNRQFYTLRIPGALARAPFGPTRYEKWVEDRRIVRAAKQAARREREHEAVRREMETEWPANVEHQLGVLERLVVQVRAVPKTRVILFEAPINPDRTSIPAPELTDAYLERIEAFAASAGVPYLRLDTQAKLTQDDFVDRTHLATVDARTRMTQALVRALAEVERDG